ncbi:MAG: nicotinamide mononucleotide transporter [Paraglaciecola sp.]|jgi:nicotinamide mononucleotide transporter
MDDTFLEFFKQLATPSWAEMIAVILALAYVWLAAHQNIWCWPCALISTGIYTWLFWEVALPFHTALNAFYLLMAVYGWFKWQEQSTGQITVQSWPIRRHASWIVLLIIISVVLSQFASIFLDADYLYLDAFITVFSVFTTVLIAHKVLENWLYWMVINTFASFLYFSKDMQPTGLLFIAYLGFAIYGYFSWRRQQQGPQLA